jgi:outer membrane cobalamin receptor
MLAAIFAFLIQQQEVRVPEVAVEDTRAVEAAPSPSETTPFVTVIDVAGSAEEVRTLAETLAASAGVEVRSLGGLGAYSAVSIRGSSSSQVAVFLDGVPLNRGALGGVDLSLLPLDALERIEVWRGQAPPELGGQAIGGAINLITRRAPGQAATSASLSYGSFGTRKVDLFRGARGKDWSYTAFVSYLGSDGDFDFRNANGTSQNPADDFTDVRKNNYFDQIDAHASVEGRGLHIAASAFWKDQGVPGTDHSDVVAARLATLRTSLDARYERGAGRVGAWTVVERRHFADPIASEFGGINDLVDWSAAGGAQGRWALPVGQFQLWSAAIEGQAERFTHDDLIVAMASTHALRVSGAATLGDTIALRGDRIVIEPSVRLDAYRTTGPQASLALAMPQMGELERSDVVASPRAGVRWRTGVEGLVAKANGGRYFRLPTFYDLYANLGYFVGRPDLRPESSWNWDAGGVWERGGLLAETSYFEQHTSDLIVYQPTFRSTSPVNAGGATARGVETALRLAGHGAQVIGNYTYTNISYDDTGKQVVGRPAHEGYVRGELERPWRRFAAGGFYEARVTAGMWADPANTLEFPARVYHAVGVRGRLLPSWTLTVEVKNLLDEREELLFRSGSACPAQQCPAAIEDFGGYPLPGRAFFATLAWKE